MSRFKVNDLENQIVSLRAAIKEFVEHDMHVGVSNCIYCDSEDLEGDGHASDCVFEALERVLEETEPKP